MIRVLHSIDTTGPGGAETVFVNLIKGLDAQKFESIVVIPGPGWMYDTLRSKGVEPIFVQSRGGFNLRYLLELVRVIRKHKIDIVQSHLFGSNLYCSLAGMICRVPVISTFHGFVDSSEMERLMSLKVRMINWGSRKIVFVSDMLREHFVQKHGFADSKAVTIYNGVDTTIFKPQKDDSIRKELGISSEHILIGAVGNIRLPKGYDILLRAAKLVYEHYPECRFVVAGEGSGKLYDSLIEFRQQLGLEKVFYFLGFHSDSAKVMNNFDIFVLPSTSEGFSISTIESLACGLPVVVTKSGGPEEIVTHGKNGLLVGSKHNDIADAVIRLIGDSDLRNDLSINSCKKINEIFSLTKMIDKYTSVYHLILLPKSEYRVKSFLWRKFTK